MRPKHILMVAIFMTLYGHILAQKYMAGKIVTNDGDTVACMIKVGKWDTNPNRIVTERNNDTKKYWPTEIASFHVDNRTFVSARVKLEVSNHLDGTLDLEDSRPKFANDSIFAELIVAGKKNLYRYKSPSYKEHFLIADQGASLESLVYKRFHVWAKVSGNEVKRELHLEEYKNQLEKYFAGCPGFDGKIAVTGYELGQLRSLFSLYSGCPN